MTLDKHPKEWRRLAKLFLVWLDLPEEQADTLIDALPESEQDKFDAFILMRQTPKRALKRLESYAKDGDLETVDALVNRLPRIELEKLVRVGLERGKLIDNLSKVQIEELRELVVLCSLPKNVLANLVFIEWVHPKRREFLLD